MVFVEKLLFVLKLNEVQVGEAAGKKALVANKQDVRRTEQTVNGGAPRWNVAS